MHRFTWFRLLPVLTAVVAGISLIEPPHAAAANVACGDAITVTTTLDGDLACNGDGLVIVSDDITLDLGGHTIAGAGGVAVSIGPGRHGITVRNGTVSGFTFGVLLIGADHNVIENVRATNSVLNGISLFRDSVGGAGSDWNVIRDCFINSAGSFGVISNGNSNDNTIERCDITATGNSGIFIGGGGGLPPSFRNTVRMNTIHDNVGTAPAISINGGSANNTVAGNNVLRNGSSTSAHGITVTSGSSNNTVEGNTVADNGGNGLNVSGLVTAGVLTAASANNQLLGNDVRRNNFGVFLGSGAQANTISGNTVVANRNQGIAATGTAPQPEGNTVERNTSYGNTTNPPVPATPFDVRDATTGGVGTAGTKNTYVTNYCILGNPVALCAPQPATLSTTSSPTGGNAPVGVSARDTATVAGGGPVPTGTVKFYLCQPGEVTAGGCEGAVGAQIGLIGGEVLVTGVATSASAATSMTPGRYCWRVEYSGDAFYLPAGHTDGTSECFTTAATVQSIMTIVDGLVADGSITMNATALLAKLAAAQAAIDRGEGAAAAGQLRAFINQINAQRGNGISPAAADVLIQQATLLLPSLP